MLLFAAEYELIVRYEEGVLESIFGREYLDYKIELDELDRHRRISRIGLDGPTHCGA